MTFQDDQDRLNRIDLRLRQQLEQAELQIPIFNASVQRIASLGLINDVVLLGEILIRRPYAPGHGPTDSNQIIQAVLLIPGGIGAAVCDTEDWYRLQKLPADLESEAALRFRAFDLFTPGEKALLMLASGPLMSRFSQLLEDWGIGEADF